MFEFGGLTFLYMFDLRGERSSFLISGATTNWTWILITFPEEVTLGKLTPSSPHIQLINTPQDFQTKKFNVSVLCIDPALFDGSQPIRTSFLWYWAACFILWLLLALAKSLENILARKNHTVQRNVSRLRFVINFLKNNPRIACYKGQVSRR